MVFVFIFGAANLPSTFADLLNCSDAAQHTNKPIVYRIKVANEESLLSVRDNDMGVVSQVSGIVGRHNVVLDIVLDVIEQKNIDC